MAFSEPSVLVFDGLGRGLTPRMYRTVATFLASSRPDVMESVCFLGSPFEKRGFSFPLKLKAEEHELDVISRLLRCWVWMNDFTIKKLLPSLAQGKIPIVLRYGLGAVLYSSYCVENAALLDDIMEAHKSLVNLRVLGQKIPGMGKPMPAPQYLIPDETPESVTEETTSNVRALHGVKPEQLRHFMPHERGIIKHYCDPVHGQKCPIWITGNSLEEMCLDATNKIVAHVERLAIAA